MAATTQPQEQQKPETEPEKMSSRDRLLAALENLNPLTKEEAEMINNAVMEARERSISEYLTSSEKQETLSRRERVLALRAKLKPISQEDGEMINKVIMEAREASIARDLSA